MFDHRLSVLQQQYHFFDYLQIDSHCFEQIRICWEMLSHICRSFLDTQIVVYDDVDDLQFDSHFYIVLSLYIILQFKCLVR